MSRILFFNNPKTISDTIWTSTKTYHNRKIVLIQKVSGYIEIPILVTGKKKIKFCDLSVVFVKYDNNSLTFKLTTTNNFLTLLVTLTDQTTFN